MKSYSICIYRTCSVSSYSVYPVVFYTNMEKVTRNDAAFCSTNVHFIQFLQIRSHGTVHQFLPELIMLLDAIYLGNTTDGILFARYEQVPAHENSCMPQAP